jgi:hypothetical protein
MSVVAIGVVFLTFAILNLLEKGSRDEECGGESPIWAL